MATKRIEIYQPNEAMYHGFTFMGSDVWARFNMPVHVSKYKKVYAYDAPLETSLDKVWHIFNVAHPADYRARSLSVSDVVVVEQSDGTKTAHFCDSFGFKFIENFFHDLPTRNMTRETDGLTVAGHKGKWHCIDSKTVGGKEFFLMEHSTHGDETPCIIVNEKGTLVLQDIHNGFDDEAIEELEMYAKDIPYLPDETAVMCEDLVNAYGYGSYHLIPVRLEVAKIIPLQVYSLDREGTESAVTDIAEIEDFVLHGGILGVEKVDWLNLCQKYADAISDVLLNATDYIGNDPEKFGADNKDIDTMRDNKSFREDISNDLRADYSVEELNNLTQAQCAELVWKAYGAWYTSAF